MVSFEASIHANRGRRRNYARLPAKWERQKTMKKLLLVVILFLALISHAAEPWQEPEDFRGFKWGVSIEELKSTLGSRIGTANLWGNRIKNYFSRRQMIGPAEVDFEYGFLDDRFSSVHIMFRSDDFPTLRAAFIERYGPPHSTREEKLQTAMGAQFLNEMLNWKGPTIFIELTKYANKVSQGRAIITKRDYL